MVRECMSDDSPRGLRIRDPLGKLRHLGSDRVYQISDLVVSMDQSTIAVCGSGGEIFAYDWPSGEQRLRVLGQGSHWALGLSGGGDLLVVSEGQRLLRFQLPSGATLLPFVAHEKPVCAVAVSPDATQILSAGREGRVTAWQANNLEPQWSVELFAKSLCYSRDGSKIAVGGASVSILDAANGATISRLKKANKKKPWHSHSVAWSRDERFVAIASESEPGTIQVVRVETRASAMTFRRQ